MSSQAIFDEVTAGLIFDLNAGDAIPAADLDPNGDYPVYGSNGIRGYTSKCNQFADIILIGRQGSVGTVHLAKAPCWVAEHALRVYPKRKLNKNWLAYALDAQNLEELSVGTAQPGISAAAVLRQKFPLPPPGMQNRIAHYLDRETEQIDETITRIDKVVDLLEERRSSIIRMLVQRDPDRNDFPTAPAGSFFKLIGSGTTPKGDEFYSDEAGIPWVTTSELREREIITTSKYVNDLALQSHSSLRVFPAGSLLIAMYGATIGRLGWLGVDATMNQACCAFSEPRGIIPEFFFYSMLADREKLALFASGGGQPNINQALLRRWRVPAPPLEIQEKAVEEIIKETKGIDVMIEKSVKTRALLEERRSALITAAVTGKIEV